MSSAYITLPLIGTVLYLLYIGYRKLLCIPFQGIPHNKEAAYTLFGDVPEMIKAIKKDGELFPWITSHITKLNSPVVQVFIRPFCKPWVIVADYKETQDILLRRTKEFDRSEATVDVFYGLAPEFQMNILSDDERFKAHRNLLKDLMTPMFLNQTAAPQIHASVTNLMTLWSLKAKLALEHPFDIVEDTYNVMLDSMTAVTFGLDITESITASRVKQFSTSSKCTVPQDSDEPVIFGGFKRPKIYEALGYLTYTVTGTLQSPFPRLHHWTMRKLPAYRNAYKIKEDMIASELEKGVARFDKGEKTQKCALDNVLHRELMAAKKEDRSPNYKTRTIIDELFGFLIAGEETTASTMLWGFKYLTANQRVQIALRDHLRAAYPQAVAESRDPTVEEITRISVPYLDATLEEIHRCAAILAMTLRRAKIDTTILGHHIPKGTDIGLCTTGPSYTTPSFPIPDADRSESSLTAKIHTNEWNYNDTNEFKPERWLKTDNDQGRELFDAGAGPQLAFGSGPRGCWGRRLAYLQMRILVVLTLWHLELLTIDGDLASFKGTEKIGRVPVYSYLRLREIE